MPTEILAPLREPSGSHQVCTRNNLNETRRTRSNPNETTIKTTNPTVILSLTTVWLQIRSCRTHNRKSGSFRSLHLKHVSNSSCHSAPPAEPPFTTLRKPNTAPNEKDLPRLAFSSLMQTTERLRPTFDCRGVQEMKTTERCSALVDMESGSMNTAFLLMAQYGGKAIIPIEDVCRDYLFAPQSD
jgi:hypothetical protein